MKKRYKSCLYTALVLFISLILIQTGCSNRKVDSSAVKEEIENREPKKVSESEIIAKSLELGAEIANRAQLKLSSSLSAALRDGDIDHAIDFCNLNAYPLLDSGKKRGWIHPIPA